ncbi:MAG: hypothetical protein JO032_21835 [Alphaproteobacteria bacterium]|nr:hypothetical protein [Alphaproteobacteria bacterium]
MAATSANATPTTRLIISFRQARGQIGFCYQVGQVDLLRLAQRIGQRLRLRVGEARSGEVLDRLVPIERADAIALKIAAAGGR